MRTNRILALALAAGLGAAAGCGDDETTITPPADVDFNRTYQQIERLGNPLVAEVFLEKRSHSAFNSVGPGSDDLFAAELEGFVATVAGRSTAVQDALSSVLLPDELIVDTSRDPATAGWLSWAVPGNGWGGRKLADDVVDTGLEAIFGPLLDTNNVTECLRTDNVDANDAAFSSTFPYLAAPH